MGVIKVRERQICINGAYFPTLAQEAAESADAMHVFASATAHAAAARLLNQKQLLAMAQAKSPEDAFKFVLDAGYGGGGGNVAPAQYESLLADENIRLKKELAYLTGNDIMFATLSYPSDYHNIKALLKGGLSGHDATGILLPDGSIGAKAMAAAYKERNYTKMTSNMRAAIEESLDSYARTSDPQKVDMICDRYCYSDVWDAAYVSNNDFVRGYAALLIDLINLRTYVRCRFMKMSPTFFKGAFIENGHVPIRLYAASYEEPMSAFAEKLSPYGLYDILTGSIESLTDDRSFTKLERLCDNAIVEYAKKSKFATFGLESVMGYAIAKKMEIKNIRIIMAGCITGLEPEKIYERIRASYG